MVIAGAVLVWSSAGRLPAEHDQPLFPDDATFALSFDYGDLDADVAVGDNKGVSNSPQRKPIFRPTPCSSPRPIRKRVTSASSG
jgi:hypothetical protein